MEDRTDAGPAVDDTLAQGKSRLWRRVRLTCYIGFSLVVLVPLAAFVVAYLVMDVKSPQEVLSGLDHTATVTYADGSELLKVVPEQGDRLFVRYDDVPEKLRDAIVAVEDPTFWQNEGFDPVGIVRAAVTGVGGGSGITQQYIKNATGNDQASYLRKFSELVLSTKLTQERRKEEIFESYINIISFGRGTFGPASAMQAYFGKPLTKDLTWSEAAFLAGMIQSPSVHDPAISGPDHAGKRWKYVANKLVERGYVLAADPMAYPGEAIVPPAETRAGRLSYEQYHLKRRVLTELEQHGFGLDKLRRGAYRVETTLDVAAQAAAARAVAEQLTGQPDNFRAGLVAVEPGSGAVRAYQGGKWSARDFAATARPAGGAFQPFVAAAGLRQGRGLEIPYPAPERAEYGSLTVKNDTNCEKPECSALEAMRKSVDTPFIAMTRAFGAKAVSDTALDAGIPETIGGDPVLREADGVTIGPNIAVGGYPLRPLDLAGAYGTFASGGAKTVPYLVQRVLDDTGTVLWEHSAVTGGGLDREVTGQISAALATALPDGRSVAMKAGSHHYGNSADNAGAWMVGYTAQLSAAVWAGGEDEQRMKDAAGGKLTGDTIPASIWRAFMLAYHQGKPFEPLPYAKTAPVVPPPDKPRGNPGGPATSPAPGSQRQAPPSAPVSGTR